MKIMIYTETYSYNERIGRMEFITISYIIKWKRLMEQERITITRKGKFGTKIGMFGELDGYKKFPKEATQLGLKINKRKMNKIRKTFNLNEEND